jgi:hypothetical protein
MDSRQDAKSAREEIPQFQNSVLGVLGVLASDLLESGNQTWLAFHSRTAPSSASPGIGRPMK